MLAECLPETGLHLQRSHCRRDGRITLDPIEAAATCGIVRTGCTEIPSDFARPEISKFNGFCNLILCVKKRLFFVQAVFIFATISSAMRPDLWLRLGRVPLCRRRRILVCSSFRSFSKLPLR
jgi:hypothetical protein